MADAQAMAVAAHVPDWSQFATKQDLEKGLSQLESRLVRWMVRYFPDLPGPAGRLGLGISESLRHARLVWCGDRLRTPFRVGSDRSARSVFGRLSQQRDSGHDAPPSVPGFNLLGLTRGVPSKAYMEQHRAGVFKETLLTHAGLSDPCSKVEIPAALLHWHTAPLDFYADRTHACTCGRLGPLVRSPLNW